MPENVRSFDYIRIKFIKFNSKSIYFRHFDANTLEFLTKITPLLADLEIIVGPIIPNRVENLRTILTILLPFLDGIRSMQCANEYTLPVVRQFLSREGFSNKLKKFSIEVFYANETGCLFKFEKIHFQIEQQEMVNFIKNWLTQTGNGGTRLLEFRSNHEFSEQVFKAIREVV